VIGSLWPVSDRAAFEITTEFYRQLREPGTSKAQALRRAKLRLLSQRSFAHPYYWSAFLLIDNWL
jgi:CHAT domain-containing protein